MRMLSLELFLKGTPIGFARRQCRSQGRLGRTLAATSTRPLLPSHPPRHHRSTRLAQSRVRAARMTAAGLPTGTRAMRVHYVRNSNRRSKSEMSLPTCISLYCKGDMNMRARLRLHVKGDARRRARLRLHIKGDARKKARLPFMVEHDAHSRAHLCLHVKRDVRAKAHLLRKRPDPKNESNLLCTWLESDRIPHFTPSPSPKGHDALSISPSLLPPPHELTSLLRLPRATTPSSSILPPPHKLPPT
jgi:hypothetical protein